MDSEVFFLVDNTGKDYVVKSSFNTNTDAFAYKLLYDNSVNIPVPKLYGSFQFEDKTILMLERLNYPLLESVPTSDMAKYIPSMIRNLKQIHKIKSVLKNSLTWKKYLLNKFSPENTQLN